HASWVFERARGVEIWTSDSSSQLFSGDHCSSRSMSSQFNQSQQHWRLCGVTESNNSQIIAGEIFTVNCVAETRQLLLRRNITSADASSYHDYMSFADLRLQTFQLEASKAELVAENSSFSVSCALRCSGPPDATSRDLQLCSPNGSCTASQELRVPRAQPQHSGNYTCRLGSVEKRTGVAVLC
uniref:Ig-like domain-containing protein n=1 Tax=Macrostomum lignano TaxID=282301 RepID=A0A1I8GI92_9PLAT